MSVENDPKKMDSKRVIWIYLFGLRAKFILQIDMLRHFYLSMSTAISQPTEESRAESKCAGTSASAAHSLSSTISESNMIQFLRDLYEESGNDEYKRAAESLKDHAVRVDSESLASTEEGFAVLMVENIPKTLTEYLNQVATMHCLALLERFLKEYVPWVLQSNPNFLKSNRQIQVSEILDFSNMLDLVSWLAKHEVKSLGFKGSKALIKYFRKRFGVTIAESECDFEALDKLVQLRNRFVHGVDLSKDKTVTKSDLIAMKGKDGEKLILRGLEAATTLIDLVHSKLVSKLNLSPSLSP